MAAAHAGTDKRVVMLVGDGSAQVREGDEEKRGDERGTDASCACRLDRSLLVPRPPPLSFFASLSFFFFR